LTLYELLTWTQDTIDQERKDLGPAAGDRLNFGLGSLNDLFIRRRLLALPFYATRKKELINAMGNIVFKNARQKVEYTSKNGICGKSYFGLG